jgi:hypothetical protein
MKNKIPVILLCIIAFIDGYAQESNALFSRLQAISNSGLGFLNVDGIEITSQMLAGDFSKRTLPKSLESIQ